MFAFLTLHCFFFRFCFARKKQERNIPRLQKIQSFKDIIAIVAHVALLIWSSETHHKTFFYSFGGEKIYCKTAMQKQKYNNANLRHRNAENPPHKQKKWIRFTSLGRYRCFQIFLENVSQNFLGDQQAAPPGEIPDCLLSRPRSGRPRLHFLLRFLIRVLEDPTWLIVLPPTSLPRTLKILCVLWISHYSELLWSLQSADMTWSIHKDRCTK